MPANPFDSGDHFHHGGRVVRQAGLATVAASWIGCLAHASYLIGSEGEAAVVDPQRDVDQYIEEAAAQNLKIKYIIETHLHADFISGHRELAALSLRVP